MQPEIKLELNDRERKRFAAMLRNIQTTAGRVADAIERGNESEAVAFYAVFVFALTPIKEFHELVDQAISDAHARMGICHHKGTTTLEAGVATCDQCGKPVTNEIFGG